MACEHLHSAQVTKQRSTQTASRYRSISSQHLAAPMTLGDMSAIGSTTMAPLFLAATRWSVAGSLEMALFGDGGNVYGRPGLIGLRDLRGDGGFGMRFKNKQQEIMRFDVGFSQKELKYGSSSTMRFGRLYRAF